MDMDIRHLLDMMALAKAGEVREAESLIQNSVTRQDIQSGQDRLFNMVGYGYLIGLPTNSVVANITTGVPVNGIAGFAKSALFINVKGSLGSFLYVNTGTNLSTTWTNIV